MTLGLRGDIALARGVKGFLSAISWILPQRRRSTFGCELRERNLCLSCIIYLVSFIFACENTFLGFELDLLIYKFLVQINLWIIYRNPWYLYLCSIYFSYSDSSCLHSAISYPESLGKSSGYSEHKTRSFRGYTWSFRADSVTDNFKVLFSYRLPIHPPLGILRSFQLVSKRGSPYLSLTAWRTKKDVGGTLSQKSR